MNPKFLLIACALLFGSSQLTYGQAVNFKRTDLYPTLNDSEKIATGDFDADGLIDLVVSGGPGFKIIFNDQAKFSRITRIASRSPYGLAADDFNSDYVTDVALSYHYSGMDSLAIFTNSGIGEFNVTQRFACPNGIGEMTSTDVNGDSMPDLILLSYTQNVFSVYLNTGAGFEEPDIHSIPVTGRAVKGGDLNNDGFTDLVIVSLIDNTFVYLLGNNDGTFQVPVKMIMPAYGYALAIADLDQDNDDDIIIGSPASTSVLTYRWTGSLVELFEVTSGTEGTNSGGISVADIDNNSFPDIVVLDWNQQQFSILYNTGGGSFDPPVRVDSQVSQPINVIAADLDNDTRIDVAFTSTISLVEIMLQKSSGTFSSQTSGHVYATSLVSADFNSDEFADLAVCDYGVGTVTILENDHNENFIITRRIAVGKGAFMVFTNDLNADGHADLVVTNTDDNTVSLIYGNGDGTFKPAVNLSTGVAPTYVAIDEFDNDDDLDFIVVNNSSGTISMFRQDNGVFTLAGARTVDEHPARIVSGDLNSDGMPDLILSFNYPLETVKFLPNTGNLTFGDPRWFNAPRDSYYGTLIRDFTGDGIADVGVIEGSVYRFYQNDGSATFTPISGLLIPYSCRDVTVGDYNGDGLDDLAFSTPSTYSVNVHLGQASGGFISIASPATYTGPVASVTADINNDGRDDIIVAASPIYYLSVLESLPAITLVADDATRQYGSTNPVFTGHVEGSVLDPALLISGYETNAETFSNVGTHAILANPTTYALQNFAVLFESGELTITPAPITVTAEDARRAEGSENPFFGSTVTGLLNGDQVAVQHATTATVNSPVGEYPIVPEVWSGGDNYTITYVNGTLTVYPVLSTEDEDNFSLSVYPNPAIGPVTVENNSSRALQYIVYTGQGNPYQRGTLNPGKTNLELPVTGLYFLKVEGRYLKIIVQ